MPQTFLTNINFFIAVPALILALAIIYFLIKWFLKHRDY